MYNIVSKFKFFLVFSAILCLASILSWLLIGLRLGIDFTGGVLMEVKYLEPLPQTSQAREKLKDFSLETIQATKDGFILRFKETKEDEREKIHQALGKIEELRFESIGSVIGKELTKKAKSAVVLAVLAILVYLAFAFRKLSKIIKKGESWRYGLAAIIALFHDVLIMIGFFVFLGYFKKVEINTTFIIAILTVLGYSVNDTIVVFDRIRENLLSFRGKDLKTVVNRSINETLIRCLNTGLSTLFVLLVLFLFGGETIRYFVLAMIVGIISGTYSSIFIASPILLFRNRK